MDLCIISLNLNCTMQLKQFFNIATKASSRKKCNYFWWSTWLLTAFSRELACHFCDCWSVHTWNVWGEWWSILIYQSNTVRLGTLGSMARDSWFNFIVLTVHLTDLWSFDFLLTILFHDNPTCIHLNNFYLYWVLAADNQVSEPWSNCFRRWYVNT